VNPTPILVVVLVVAVIASATGCSVAERLPILGRVLPWSVLFGLLFAAVSFPRGGARDLVDALMLAISGPMISMIAGGLGAVMAGMLAPWILPSYETPATPKEAEYVSGFVCEVILCVGFAAVVTCSWLPVLARMGLLTTNG